MKTVSGVGSKRRWGIGEGGRELSNRERKQVEGGSRGTEKRKGSTCVVASHLVYMYSTAYSG